MAWDLDQFIEDIYKRKLLPEHTIKELCEKAKEILVDEGNIKELHAPVTIVGDVHGLVSLSITECSLCIFG